MRELAEMLGLKDSQIYKWHWDRSQTVHKRFQKSLRKINNVSKSLEDA
jgi:succinate dehydrogenase flavin-adding protein (antitoxin of CptAB toxin-antitoxin module)